MIEFFNKLKNSFGKIYYLKIIQKIYMISLLFVHLEDRNNFPYQKELSVVEAFAHLATL